MRASSAVISSTGDSFFCRIISATCTAGVNASVSLSIPVALCSVGRAAAGNVEHAASGEAALLARQPADQRCNLIDLTKTSERNLRQHEVDMLLRHLREQRRADRCRCDAVYPDVGLCQLLAE